MESYESAVDLALMVVNLDKSVYKTMIRSGLKQYLNTVYNSIAKDNKKEMAKFILSSKILLNDLQAIPVNSCGGRTCTNCFNCMMNECDKNINYKTEVYDEALIDPYNITNSNVTRYNDKFNPNTFNPQLSRLSQPLDTIGLYHDSVNLSLANYDRISGYGPEAKVRNEEHFENLTTHPINDVRNATYSQYSSVYFNDNGNGFYDQEITKQINNQKPINNKYHYTIRNGNIIH